MSARNEADVTELGLSFSVFAKEAGSLKTDAGTVRMGKLCFWCFLFCFSHLDGSEGTGLSGMV